MQFEWIYGCLNKKKKYINSTIRKEMDNVFIILKHQNRHSVVHFSIPIEALNIER